MHCKCSVGDPRGDNVPAMGGYFKYRLAWQNCAITARPRRRRQRAQNPLRTRCTYTVVTCLYAKHVAVRALSELAAGALNRVASRGGRAYRIKYNILRGRHTRRPCLCVCVCVCIVECASVHRVKCGSLHTNTHTRARFFAPRNRKSNALNGKHATVHYGHISVEHARSRAFDCYVAVVSAIFYFA